MIAFDAGSVQTKGKLYEVRLEKSESGIMPINEITKCEINQGIHESVIPIESKEDEWNVHWPLNSEEEKVNENADDNELSEKDSVDLHHIINRKAFDQIDTKPIVPNENSSKSTIDSVANQLGECFERMLSNLTEIYLQDPNRLNQGVTMFLGATAGMRLLQIEDKLDNSLRSQLIFMHIRNEFQHRLSLMSKHWPTINDYFHTRIGVITGKEESIAAWVACSYLLRRSYADSTHSLKSGNFYDALNLFDKGTTLASMESSLMHETAIDLVRKTGIVHLGGTSIRITFPISDELGTLNKTIEKHRGNIDELRIMNVKYEVYAESYLCFGLDKIWSRSLIFLVNQNASEQVHLHPCLNSDVQFNRTIESLTSQICLRSAHKNKKEFKFGNYQFKGRFNSEMCYRLINDLIDYEECSKMFMFCARSNMLAPQRNLTFIATSKLYHLTRVFGKSTVNVPHSLWMLVQNDWCKKDLNLAVDLYGLYKIILYKHSVQYCFALHYVESMFTNVFQIAREDFVHISFINQLAMNDIEWPVGYLIGNLDLKAAQYDSSVFFTKISNIFIILLSFSPLFLFWSFKEEIKHAYNVVKFKYFLN